MKNNIGYPSSVSGPAKKTSPAKAVSNGSTAYYEKETSVFPFSCSSTTDCTGIKTHSIPFEEVEHIPYQEIYPYLPNES